MLGYPLLDTTRNAPISAIHRFAALAKACNLHLEAVGTITPLLRVGEVLGWLHPLADNRIDLWLRNTKKRIKLGRLTCSEIRLLASYPALGLAAQLPALPREGCTLEQLCIGHRTLKTLKAGGITDVDMLRLLSSDALLALKDMTWADVHQIQLALHSCTGPRGKLSVSLG